MSNSDVFGSPMILTGRKPVSPFGAAFSDPYGHDSSGEPAVLATGRRWMRVLRSLVTPLQRDRRIRKTVVELSKLDDRMLRDIGLNRAAIVSAAQEADRRKGRRYRR